MYDELITAIRKTACQFKECGMCPKGKEPCIDRYAMQAADVIEELESVVDNFSYLSQTKVPHWIPVTEGLPEPYTWVLVSAEKHSVAFDAFYDGAQWKDAVLNGLIVTHWMPLPEPPKEDNNNED